MSASEEEIDGAVTSARAMDRRAVFRRAFLWLAFLAPFFYLTYGMANWLTSLRTEVPNLAFSWEKHIPFIAWTIIPYWSINAFYALSLFVNETPQEVSRLARRYLTAQIVAVTCFIAFPLQAIFVRPETHGLPGFMFDVLGGFDKPFNQAPSLHIALLVIIWDHWRRRLAGAWRAGWHGWCLLIGISVLTTWQHHVIDIPMGAMLGLFAVWLFPDNGPSPLAGFQLATSAKARKLAACYATGTILLLVLTILETRHSGVGLLLLWPVIALAIVALAYAGAGAAVFQKRIDGRVRFASRWLLLPYRFGVRANILCWTWHRAPAAEIANGIFLGRMPTRHELTAYRTVIDMTSELQGPMRPGVIWHSFPSMDLLPLPVTRIREAALAIEAARPHGPVLICCALGFQRSAIVAACWLVRAALAANSEEAVAAIKTAGRPIRLPVDAYAAIEEAAR